MKNSVFKKVVLFFVAAAVVLTSAFALFACNKEQKPVTLADVFLTTSSPNEFTSYKTEFVLPAGWEVYTTSASSSSESATANSDVGYIKRIDTAEDEIIISFNGSDITIDSTQLADLDLAYAISIHKAQGSEYNQIIIPIITAFSIMLKRNLIYTGITRAKKKVVLVGHKRALAQAIRTNVIAKRNTQLGRRIIASINKISSRGD